MKFFLTLAAFIFLLSSCGERTVTRYVNHADAIKDDAVGRGWIPDFVPNDATDIYESHSVDAGQVVVSFKSNSKDFLSSFIFLHLTHKSEAKKVFNSIDFPGPSLASRADYYVNCGTEGIGLLAVGHGSNRYFYFEPLTSENWSKLCA